MVIAMDSIYKTMNPQEAESFDGGIEWCCLVTGKNKNEHLFSVYGTSKEDAEKKANSIIQAINFKNLAIRIFE